MAKLLFVPTSEIKRIQGAMSDKFSFCEILADICRLNTLSMIKEASSGHIGSSFSSMDVITWLFTQEMRDPNSRGGDIFFSSKGHDVPALYSLLVALEKLDYSMLHKLRRLGGLPGHPDIHTPGIMANTGSLGMGISKARGMAIANRLNNQSVNIYILSGDGELQEGQIWESLRSAANGSFGELTLIVDNNKIQSDTFVKAVNDLGRLEDKFRSFGWEAARCNGHDFHALETAFFRFKQIKDKPKVIIADTIKGKGVSFIEGRVLPPDGLYKFHSGAPSDEDYEAAKEELLERINKKLEELSFEKISVDEILMEPPPRKKNLEWLVNAYSDELLKIAQERKEIVVLDADLVKDCGLVDFKKEFPESFIECGIAEQDMVSAAGGLALRGKLPIVHSFACFLSARPNEQVYNNATEDKKIIYVGSLAGILPSGPGHSHQSVRDISALGGIPGLILVEPCNEKETRAVLRWAVLQSRESVYIRLSSISHELPYVLPSDYALIPGKGSYLKKTPGAETLVISYGPTILKECFLAAQKLERDAPASVMNLPWLNCFDKEWLLDEFTTYKKIIIVEDHYTKGGQAHFILGHLAGSNLGERIAVFGIDKIPACGQNAEVLLYHGLDSDSLVERIRRLEN